MRRQWETHVEVDVFEERNNLTATLWHLIHYILRGSPLLETIHLQSLRDGVARLAPSSSSLGPFCWERAAPRGRLDAFQEGHLCVLAGC